MILSRRRLRRVAWKVNSYLNNFPDHLLDSDFTHTVHMMAIMVDLISEQLRNHTKLKLYGIRVERSQITTVVRLTHRRVNGKMRVNISHSRDTNVVSINCQLTNLYSVSMDDNTCVNKMVDYISELAVVWLLNHIGN